MNWRNYIWNMEVKYYCTPHVLIMICVLFSILLIIGTRQLFHSHEITAEFRKKWNLDVYFSLRFSDISSAIETKLTTYLNQVVVAALIKNESYDNKLILETSLSLW